MTGAPESPDNWFPYTEWIDEETGGTIGVEPKSSRKQFIRGAGCVALAVGTTIVPTWATNRGPSDQIPIPNVRVFPYEKYQLNLLTTCPPVNAEEIQKVTNILDQSPDPRVAEIAASNSEYVTYQDVPGFRQIAEQDAKRQGLTLIDERPYREKMFDIIGERGLGSQEALKITNEYIQRFGFDVSIYTDDQEHINNLVPFDNSGERTFSHYDWYTALNFIVNSIRFMPKEEIEAIGLKHLRIVRAFRGDDGQIDWGKSGEVFFSSSDTVNISIASLGDQEGPDYTIFHEMGHVGDFTYCHGFELSARDSQYNHLNPNGFTYQGKKYKKFNGWHKATDSQYGSQSIYEDKADVEKFLLPGINRAIALKSPRAIRQKYEILAARLPLGVVEYIAETSP